MSLKVSLLPALNIVFLVTASPAFCGPNAVPVERAVGQDVEPWWKTTLIAQYDSKYVFRGVNSLPGSGIAVTELTLRAYDLSLDIWQAFGVRKRFHEIDFTFAYANEFGPVTFSGGYVNYYTSDDDGLELGYKDTQELFAAATCKIASSFTASLSCNSDIDKINGSYLELSLVDSITVVYDRVTLEPYASMSYDFHYNSTARGWNNFEIGLRAPIKLGEHLSVAGFASLSIPLHGTANIAKKEGWGGFRVAFKF